MSDNLQPFTDEERSIELENYTLFAHGFLSALHSLGTLYHLNRGNKIHSTIHGLAGIYSAISTAVHYKHSQRLKENNESTDG